MEQTDGCRRRDSFNMNPKDISRFMDKIEKTNNCWNWTGSVNDGYGQFWYKKRVSAHRFSYELFKETIPQGLQLDHLCRNRKCVNPEHLEAVTTQINTVRGLTGKINHFNKNKTHCPKGHEYSGVNNKERKICQICRTEQQRQYVIRRKLNVC
jgi:hypothetical protein